MTRFLLDTSCLVAAVCQWHEHHQATREELERRRRARQALVMAAPALIEAYAVLTRLPPPHRLSPSDTLALLEGNWGKADTVALSPIEYWRLLKLLPDAGVTGGQAYDAVIVACARKAGVEVLLTWNLAHFARFQDDDLAIMAPAQALQ
ncbi:MAG: PIN domain-containing protein [Deinococcus sp.]|nr:PIN domain-containing protein [Deinococcus sp.]